VSREIQGRGACPREALPELAPVTSFVVYAEDVGATAGTEPREWRKNTRDKTNNETMGHTR